VKSEPRIVLFDLETLPNLVNVMQNFTRLGDYPGLTLKADINSIICFGWKVFGDSRTHCTTAWDFKSVWARNINDDEAVVRRAYEVLSQADAVVTHNGKRFDWRFLQTRILHHGLKPLPKIPHIDTCQVAKSNLYAFNNRLNTIAKLLSAGQKLENGGWDLWVKVMQRDPKSMRLMKKYCMQDVLVLEKVFKKLRPFISNIPNYNIFGTHTKNLCPACGSTRIKKDGTRVTKTRITQRMRCNDCGSLSHITKDGEKPRS
jgi:DNA polymerase elongation subunit (family B)